MTVVQKMATKRSFINGSLVEPGFPVKVDTDMLSGKEKNLADVSDFRPAVVQNAAIAPTGPNPTAPQQIGPDTIQTVAGYAKPGAVVVGEVTQVEKERMAPIEAGGNEAENLKKIAAAKAQATQAGTSTQNDDDALVDGTVAEITADLGGKTDEQLGELRAAEVDREKPRKGVLSAIDAEMAKRKETAAAMS